eukprot:TRINITY_DN1653_c0_g2_i5.p1 TRINITY_DN1653_c0_g2~~TRINITY_DN1653_c0_g2_i5.p1  ORF type:complete len:850 (+),score=138.47 TRINITY_DN1653_c0_g2_i5:281-2830(+)
METLPVQGHSAVVYDGKIIIYGGRDKDKKMLTDVWYMEAEGKGELNKMMARGVVPSPRCFHTAHEFDDVMYIVHGLTQEGGADEVILPALNLATGEWAASTTTGDLPASRCNHASAIYNNSIYMSGGFVTPAREDTTQESSMYVLNLHSLIWSRVDIAPSPGPLWGHSMVACSKNLLVYGGITIGEDTESDQIWVFSFKHQEWRSFSMSSSQPVAMARAVYDFEPYEPLQIQLAKNDLIMMAPESTGPRSNPGWVKGRVDGGEEGWFPENRIERIPNPSRSSSLASSSKTFSSYAAPKRRIMHCAAAMDGDRSMVICGGEVGNPPTRYSDSWIFNLKKGRWKQIAKRSTLQPPPHSGQPMVWHKGCAYVPLFSEKSVFKLDIETGWSSTTVKPQPPEHSMAAQLSPSRRVASPSPEKGDRVMGRTETPQTEARSEARAYELTASPARHSDAPSSVQRTTHIVPASGTTVVHGVSIGSEPNGNVIQVGGTDGQGDARTVVVYVMGQGAQGPPAQGPGGMPGILPANMSTVYNPTPVREGGYSVPGYHGGSLTSVPAEHLGEPARNRLASRTRTSSPHVHTKSEFRSRALPTPPSPPRSPSLVPAAMPTPSIAPTPMVTSQQTPMMTSQPAAPMMALQPAAPLSPVSASLSRPVAPLAPAERADVMRSATPVSTLVRAVDHTPAASQGREDASSDSSSSMEDNRAAYEAVQPAEPQREQQQHQMSQAQEPLIQSYGHQTPPRHRAGMDAPAPAPNLSCPSQAATPPRPLTPIGHPRSPPRSTSSSHTNYREPSSMAALPVQVDGPAGSRDISEDRQLLTAAHSQRSFSRHEALGWAKTPRRAEDKASHLWC